MNKSNIEKGLKQLAELESSLRRKSLNNLQPSSVSAGEEIPRSELSRYREQSGMMTTMSSLPPHQYSSPNDPESFLPKQGAEVLQADGQMHPVVKILLEERMPSEPFTHETDLSMAVQPPISTESGWNVQEQVVPQERGIGSFIPNQSPIISLPQNMKSFQNQTPSSPSSNTMMTSDRNILFIYPPSAVADAGTINKCFHQAELSVLRPNDNLTICWAGGSASKSTSLAEESKTTVEGIKTFPQTINIRMENFSQTKEELRQQSLPIYKLLSSLAPLKEGKEIKVRLEHQASIRWLIQQEFDNHEAVSSKYDLVIMPCLLPERGADVNLEQFLLNISPCPVALLRCP